MSAFQAVRRGFKSHCPLQMKIKVGNRDLLVINASDKTCMDACQSLNEDFIKRNALLNKTFNETTLESKDNNCNNNCRHSSIGRATDL